MNTRPADARLLPTALAGAIAMATAMGFGRFAFTPILPGMVSGLPLTSAEAGLIAAGNFAGYLVGAVLAAFGWAAGRERLVALSGLVVTVLALFAMGLAGDVTSFIAIRFIAGLASAFAMIFTSSIVLGHAALNGGERVQSLHFGGVGVGIALSSLMVFVLARIGADDPARWRLDWFVGAAIATIATLVVIRLLPAPPRQSHTSGPAPVEPALVFRPPLVLITLSYGLFGFGYVITATFIVTMARMGDAGATVEFLTWFVTGLAAATSIFAWGPVMARVGLLWSYVLCLVVDTAGIVASVVLPLPWSPLVGGLLLGATFMVVTAYGLRIGRQLAPQSPRRALAVMTAAFGVGQIVGPLVAGAMAQRTGSFAAASLVAAGAVVLAMVVALPVRAGLRD